MFVVITILNIRNGYGSIIIGCPITGDSLLAVYVSLLILFYHRDGLTAVYVTLFAISHGRACRLCPITGGGLSTCRNGYCSIVIGYPITGDGLLAVFVICSIRGGGLSAVYVSLFVLSQETVGRLCSCRCLFYHRGRFIGCVRVFICPITVNS